MASAAAADNNDWGQGLHSGGRRLIRFFEVILGTFTAAPTSDEPVIKIPLRGGGVLPLHSRAQPAWPRERLARQQIAGATRRLR